MDRVIVSRHGESVAVAKGIENGDPATDAGLTESGREEARRLGLEIAHDPIDLCITSRFPRVQQTATLALAGRPVPCLVNPNLDDINYGAFEGAERATYQAWVQVHDLATPLPGGESKVQVAARLCDAFDNILQRRETCALVVTHELLVVDLLHAVNREAPTGPHPDIPFATPYRLTADEVGGALSFLRQWIGRRPHRSASAGDQS